MAAAKVPITCGPDRWGLLRAVSDPEVRAVFGTPQGLLEVKVSAVEEIGEDGSAFIVWGHLESSAQRGAAFTGNYSCPARAGRLAIKVK
jgi:hypothetical protein